MALPLVQALQSPSRQELQIPLEGPGHPIKKTPRKTTGLLELKLFFVLVHTVCQMGNDQSNVIHYCNA